MELLLNYGIQIQPIVRINEWHLIIYYIFTQSSSKELRFGSPLFYFILPTMTMQFKMAIHCEVLQH